MSRYDPDRVADGRRPVASHYYPLIGPYDSADPAVVEYHRLLMKLAGFDGLVADWYVTADLHDYPAVHRNTGALLPAAARTGLAVGVCLEDQVATRLVAAGRRPSGWRTPGLRWPGCGPAGSRTRPTSGTTAGRCSCRSGPTG